MEETTKTSEERIDEILEQRREHYNKTYILFEIVKSINHKELAFLTAKGFEGNLAFRYMWASTIDYMKSHFTWADFLNKPMNVYTSVARFGDNAPTFSYNVAIRRSEEKYKDFNANFKKYVAGLDVFFDMDGKDGADKSFADMKKLKEILDIYKVPYFVQNSSFKGFHIIVPSEYVEYDDLDELLVTLNIVIRNLKFTYNLETLDEMVVDVKRLRKASYSYNCDGSLVLPLTDIQIDLFRSDMVSYRNASKAITFLNRGLLVREHGLTKAQLIENVKTFIAEHKNI